MTPIPILGVPDVTAARDYFVDSLGFACTGFFEPAGGVRDRRARRW